MIHKAEFVGPNGEVSALCYRIPKAIKPPHTWTLLDKEVTCHKCKRALKVKRK